jgi:hypothetical protein
MAPKNTPITMQKYSHWSILRKQAITVNIVSPVTTAQRHWSKENPASPEL